MKGKYVLYVEKTILPQYKDDQETAIRKLKTLIPTSKEGKETLQSLMNRYDQRQTLL
jgi:hypothetical protein